MANGAAGVASTSLAFLAPTVVLGVGVGDDGGFKSS